MSSEAERNRDTSRSFHDSRDDAFCHLGNLPDSHFLYAKQLSYFYRYNQSL